jgi:hypothetical protein
MIFGVMEGNFYSACDVFADRYSIADTSIREKELLNTGGGERIRTAA